MSVQKRSLSFGWACVCGLSLVGCGEAIRNPDFDRWCGDMPCEWQVEGDVERVGTWHTNDYAVELLSDDAQVSQVNGTIDERVNCLAFSLVAKIDRGVHVYLELDFLNDGRIDFSQQLPTSDWDRLTFRITAPDWYNGVRFIVRKEGPGRAVLAELGAEIASGQCTAPPVELSNRPAGARCTKNSDCEQGSCKSNVCAGCSDDSACGEGELCGIGLMSGAEFQACIAKGLGQFGTPCRAGDQCQSGFCSNKACSECEGESCGDGRRCQLARSERTHAQYWPSLCDPGMTARAEGELCTSDADCSSLRCRDIGYGCQTVPICSGAGCGALACASTMTTGGECE